jgi:tagaturonate reductase
LADGKPVDEVKAIACVSRGLVATTDWNAVLDVAQSPDLRLIVSNVTEAGYVLHEKDRINGLAPVSFPAKLLCVLKSRFEANRPGVTVLPCELMDNNANRLQDLVLQQADQWGMSGEFLHWMKTEVFWLNTLVDRIVSGKPSDHPLLAHDGLLTVAEPFSLWVIEGVGKTRDLFSHPAITVVPNAQPYSLRKVRILNGAHSGLVCKALPLGFETVREAVAHRDIRAWLRRVLFEEIVPTVQDRVQNAKGFAEQTLERFANPFLAHRLADIALHHETKVAVRLLPTYREYCDLFDKEPPLLKEILTDYLER